MTERSSCYGFGVGGEAPTGGASSLNSKLRADPDPRILRGGRFGIHFVRMYGLTPDAHAHAGRGCVGRVSADRTHNAPYGRGGGRAAGGVTGGGSQAAAGMFVGIEE